MIAIILNFKQIVAFDFEWSSVNNFMTIVDERVQNPIHNAKRLMETFSFEFHLIGRFKPYYPYESGIKSSGKISIFMKMIGFVIAQVCRHHKYISMCIHEKSALLYYTIYSFSLKIGK